MPIATQNARSVPGTEIPCYAFASPASLARHVAELIAGIIRQKNSVGEPAVLGLATGSTPVGVYRELIRLHREDGLDFSNVVTFNLDEYYGLEPDRLQSYHRWMHEHLFHHINVPPENIHIPDGTVQPADVEAYCLKFEADIERSGGIDLQLLGIGRNGHIGFNEPFSEPHSRTRLVTLDPVTRGDAASDFYGEDGVPTQAITMGLGTILDARRVILIALGEHKAKIIREAAEGPLTNRVPASTLREHPDAAFMLDDAAAAELTGVATPWVAGNVEWTEPLLKRAVLWLCEQTGKALLKLDAKDFRNHDLHQLIRRHGPAEQLCEQVFGWMMQTIEPHPAGRHTKRIICFSPHPDDDVISMGGTLHRLVQDGHETHVAYMTSGNIAVFDHDVRRISDFVTEYNRMFDLDSGRAMQVEAVVNDFLNNKGAGQPDSDETLKIKALVRWSEAKSAARVVGITEQFLHFLDLPFYRTGTIAKRPISDADVAIVRGLIERVEPAQIYVAGDLSDPHGTHRVCADAIFQAIDEIDAAGGTRPEVLLYRGAWQEWPAYEIEIAVPLSPREIEIKRAAIFRHESQKDSALFPGADPREFWQRAEERNRHTADVYNQLGLPEYFALEGFVRWDGTPL